MVKTFFEYLKKRWWTVLIFIFLIPFSIACAWITMFYFSFTGGSSEHLFPYFVVCIISSVVLVLVMSISWLIITIPASRKIGRERGKSPFKYLMGYQSIILCISAILFVYPYYNFLISNFSY
jgi:hypothetical protein